MFKIKSLIRFRELSGNHDNIDVTKNGDITPSITEDGRVLKSSGTDTKMVIDPAKIE